MRIKLGSGSINKVEVNKPVETKPIIEPKKEDIVITTPVVVEKETWDLDLNLDECLDSDDEI